MYDKYDNVCFVELADYKYFPQHVKCIIKHDFTK